jgi:hypothetical protein
MPRGRRVKTTVRKALFSFFLEAFPDPVVGAAVYLEVPCDALVCPSFLVEGHDGEPTLPGICNLVVRVEAPY